MNKLSCVIASPVDTFSGYGTMSRSFIKSLIKVRGNEWDIKLLSLRWGNTPFGALNTGNPDDIDLQSRIIDQNQIKSKPDVWIQISVANEFKSMGVFNIGYSCLVETTLVPAPMIEGLNAMDLNLVSCEHAKTTAKEVIWEKKDNNGVSVGKVKLEKPMETLFLGLDTTVYKKPTTKNLDLSYINEDFCFLAVGHLLPGADILEDRKMVGRLIKGFLEAFKGKKNKPALILKSSVVGHSYVHEEATLKIISSVIKTVDDTDLPNIYLLHGELTEEEMCELYVHPKVKAFTLMGNEGFGLPYIEFSAVSGKPIVASPWSGHMDFLEKEFNLFVEGAIEPIHQATVNDFLLKESSWFKPNVKSISDKLQEIYSNYSKYVDGGKRQGYRSRTVFSMDKMAEKLDELLKKYTPAISRPVPISLPKLASIKKPDPEYLEEIK
jgi:glycosyltransferase involved in cell wall biosynthesis